MSRFTDFFRCNGSLLPVALALFATPVIARAQVADSPAQGEAISDTILLSKAAADAQRQLKQTFTNLQFEEFGPAPVKGPLYQAIAGGRVVYYAPQSEHILFAAVYDRNGKNVTALAQDESARKHLAAVDPKDALVIGQPGAPTIIEFTDPDCPYCRALDHFWAAKAAEGKPVRRLVYFVSGIHEQAAAKAEHILCAPDPEATFKAIYGGAAPEQLHKCATGQRKVEADAALVRKIGVSGTPTLIANGKLISGFQQAELEAFLEEAHKSGAKQANSGGR
jgi:thiol:disulfide interchange protein DsbC